MKRLTFAIAVLFLTSVNLQAQWADILAGSRGSAAPTVITKDATNSNHATGTTNTFTLAQTALVKGYVTVTVAFFYFADNTVAATYDGHAMTLLKIQQRAGGASNFAAIFGLPLDSIAEDGAGTKTIVVTLTGGGGSFALDCGATSWSGVNQSATFTVAGNTNSDASPTCSIATGAATDVVVCGVGSQGSVSTITCGDTLLWSIAGGQCAGASMKAGTGGSVTATWTTSNANDWETVAVCLTL